MKSVSVLVIVLAVLSLCGTIYAERTTWYVHPDSALNTIQAGLDSCADNDIVLVGPGTYFECLVWPNTQGIHLISELGPVVTVIDGDSSGGNYGTVISCTYDVDTTTIIMDFTIQNGHYPVGGGIRFEAGSPKIIGNNIINNYTWYGAYGGGGIFISDGSPIILDNYIALNQALSGGGIWCGSQDSTSIATIIGNTIVNNRAYGWNRPGSGSAIICYPNTAVLKHNNIYGNYGYTYDCVSCAYAVIESCMIYDNYSTSPFTCIVCNGGSEIHHCDIFGNGHAVSGSDSVDYVNAEYNWWGDSTGPYHPDSNPGGLGDTVGDYVDFEPWLSWPVGVEEQPVVKPVETHENLTATIFRGPLQLPEGKKCKVFDITGRVVEPTKMQPGIYFIEVDGVVTQKVVKVR